MKALITGVAGFVGSTLADHLLQDETVEVLGVDRLTDYYDVGLKRANLRQLTHPRFSFVEGDLNSLDLRDLFRDVTHIFHQAGQPGVRKSWGADFSSYTVDNVNATQRLLEAAKDLSTLQRLVYASSSSVYGDAERYPTLETDRPTPLSPYGVTKLAAEHLVSLYAQNFSVPTVSLRYFTVYGPKQRPDMAFTRFLQAVDRGEEISIFGDGQQVRDFTFVADIVRANVSAATTEVRPGSVFNVAGGSSVSVLEVLDTIEKVSGKPVKVRHLAAVSGDVRRTGGSTHEIQKALDWAPEVTLEEGLARQWAWVQKERV